jgi:hypothetical protein
MPREKGSKGVLGAPLTMEWVTMAEAVEALAVGRLLHKWGEGGEGWPAREAGAAAYRCGLAAASDRGSRNVREFIPRVVAATGTAPGGQWDASGGQHSQ